MRKIYWTKREYLPPRGGRLQTFIDPYAQRRRPQVKAPLRKGTSAQLTFCNSRPIIQSSDNKARRRPKHEGIVNSISRRKPGSSRKIDARQTVKRSSLRDTTPRYRISTECLREDYSTRLTVRRDCVVPRDHRFHLQDGVHVLVSTESRFLLLKQRSIIFRKEIVMAVEMRDCRFGGRVAEGGD